MSESKKLSELIKELVFYSIGFYHERKNSELFSMENQKFRKAIIEKQNQIDQKFEELRREGKEDENGWEVTYMGVPTSNRIVGRDKIKSILPDIDENCCMREGIEFSHYDGKLITMKCSKHKYAPNPKKIS